MQDQSQDVLAAPGRNSFFVNLKLRDDLDTTAARDAFAEFCAAHGAVLASMGKRYPASNIHGVFGVGRGLWDRLLAGTAPPRELVTFEAIAGAHHTAPSTEGDLFLHLRADTADLCYEVLRQYMPQLQAFTQPVYEIHGFSYLDGRAIIGFVDGTENPVGSEAHDSVVIGEEDPDYAGGSYLFTQKYLHDMAAWDALATEEQERIIGRRKFDDVELTDEQKHPNAHNVISQAHDDEGNELKILRANVIFANPSQGEYGTFFISYSRYFSTVEQMLRNMFQGNEHGPYDKLLEVSTAVTGTLFFVPSLELVERLAAGELS